MKRLQSFASAAPLRFASAVATATNEITRHTPAPKDLPYFGLDHPIGVAAQLLDRLSELGIFRHYERVLDLDAGVGGPARWLARRRGCEVVSIDRAREQAAANALLVRRSHLEGDVTVLVGEFDDLPAADASFTHAWSIDGLGSGEAVQRLFAELFRVVRPGGHVALQEWFRTDGADVSGAPCLERVTEELSEAGFRDVRALEAEHLLEPEATIAGIARGRAVEILGHPRPSERSRIASAFLELEAREQAIAKHDLTLVQVFAQRPA